GYQPLSGLAVAAIAVAGVYSGALAVFGIVALITGTPLALAFWILIFPVVAMVLAVVARQQIRYSEGTRTGLTLTTWAWWLSVVFGLGYLAFYVGTFLAVWWQAESQMKSFFELGRKGHTPEAF